MRIRTDLAAVSEDAPTRRKHDVYDLWPRIRCPVLLVRATTPLVPGGGLVVSAADAERFAAEIPHAEVVNLDADHYSVLIDPVAIDTIARFLRAAPSPTVT